MASKPCLVLAVSLGLAVVGHGQTDLFPPDDGDIFRLMKTLSQVSIWVEPFRQMRYPEFDKEAGLGLVSLLKQLDADLRLIEPLATEARRTHLTHFIDASRSEVATSNLRNDLEWRLALTDACLFTAQFLDQVISFQGAVSQLKETFNPETAANTGELMNVMLAADSMVELGMMAGSAYVNLPRGSEDRQAKQLKDAWSDLKNVDEMRDWASTVSGAYRDFVGANREFQKVSEYWRFRNLNHDANVALEASEMKRVKDGLRARWSSVGTLVVKVGLVAAQSQRDKLAKEIAMLQRQQASERQVAVKSYGEYRRANLRWIMVGHLRNRLSSALLNVLEAFRDDLVIPTGVIPVRARTASFGLALRSLTELVATDERSLSRLSLALKPHEPTPVPAIRLDRGRTVFQPGEEVAVTFDAPKTWPENAFLALVPASEKDGLASSLRINYGSKKIDKRTLGRVTWRAPSAEGVYTIRMYDGPADGRMAVKVQFEVRKSLVYAGLAK